MPRNVNNEAANKMLLWRPEVHTRFGESLYYFLIGFRGFTEHTFEDLRRDLRDLEIEGCCLYSLFGVYDALLRVWLNPLRYEELRRRLPEKPYVAAVLDFAVTGQMHWAFLAERRTQESQAAIVRTIEEYDPADFDKAQKGDRQLIERMDGDHLLVEKTTWFPRKVKFYISVSQPPAGLVAQVATIARRIQGRMERYPASVLDNRSLYFGRGFASLLLKGVAPNLDRLIDIAQDIRLEIAEYSLTTATFILGRRIEAETDFIQPGSLRQEYAYDPGVYAWIPELYDPGKPPATPDRIRVAEAYLTRNGLFRHLRFNSRLWLGRLVVGLIRQTVSETTGSPLASDILSSWFRETESWMRDRLDAYLTAAVDKLGVERIDLARAVKFPANTKFASLGEMIDAADQLAGRLKGHARGFLSKDDRAIINQIVNLRNLVQHNDLRYLNDWENTIDLVVQFMPIFSAIREEIEAAIERRFGEQPDIVIEEEANDR